MLKQYIDHHVHSSHSPDSVEPMEEIILKAKSLGLQSVMFTDHVDYDAADVVFDTTPDYKAYKNKLICLQVFYSIRLLMGVEIGYQSHVKDKINNFVSTQPFDFVILSIHYAERLDLSNGDFFKNRTQVESYQRYYEILLDAITTNDNFDVVGHLDYVIRYGDRNAYHYEDYREIIDRILKVIIRKNKGLDLNTSGYRYQLDQFHPSFEILIRYKELGGTIITLGSDAHKKEHLQQYFTEAIDVLRSIGFTHVTHFENRIPHQIEI